MATLAAQVAQLKQIIANIMIRDERRVNIHTDFFGDAEFPDAVLGPAGTTLLHQERAVIQIFNLVDTLALRRLVYAFAQLQGALKTVLRKEESKMTFLRESSLKSKSRDFRRRPQLFPECLSEEEVQDGDLSHRGVLYLQNRVDRSKSVNNSTLLNQSRKNILAQISKKLSGKGQQRNEKNSKTGNPIIRRQTVTYADELASCQTPIDDNWAATQQQSKTGINKKLVKIESLLRNIKKQKQLSNPVRIHERKPVAKLPSKSRTNLHMRIFLEEIQSLRRQVQQIRSTNEVILRESRSKTHKSEAKLSQASKSGLSVLNQESLNNKKISGNISNQDEQICKRLNDNLRKLSVSRQKIKEKIRTHVENKNQNPGFKNISEKPKSKKEGGAQEQKPTIGLGNQAIQNHRPSVHRAQHERELSFNISNTTNPIRIEDSIRENQLESAVDLPDEQADKKNENSMRLNLSGIKDALPNKIVNFYRRDQQSEKAPFNDRFINGKVLKEAKPRQADDYKESTWYKQYGSPTYRPKSYNSEQKIQSETFVDYSSFTEVKKQINFQEHPSKDYQHGEYLMRQEAPKVQTKIDILVDQPSSPGYTDPLLLQQLNIRFYPHEQQPAASNNYDRSQGLSQQSYVPAGTRQEDREIRVEPLMLGQSSSFVYSTDSKADAIYSNAFVSSQALVSKPTSIERQHGMRGIIQENHKASHAMAGSSQDGIYEYSYVQVGGNTLASRGTPHPHPSYESVYQFYAQSG